MSSRRAPRFAASLRERRDPARESAPWPERLLHALGASPSFADAVLGDLAEERAAREEQSGWTAARWWYACEAVRAVPHLLRNALSHGDARSRVRATAIVGALAVVPAAIAIAVLLRAGPPARIVVDPQHGADLSDGILLNTTRPVQLAVHVLDAQGRELPSAQLHYQRESGAPLAVSAAGAVTCKRRGDAKVSASAGAVSAAVLVHCRPVKRVITATWISLVMGDSGEDLTFLALGPDSNRVEKLTGALSVDDSTIATLSGVHLRPVAPGRTYLSLHVGDADAGGMVTVFERVPALSGLRPDQRFVVAPVRVRPSDTIQWALPKGLFSLHYARASTPQPLPTFAVDGPVMCMPDFTPTVEDVNCLVRGPGATIRITHPVSSAMELTGRLALDFWPDPQAAPSRPSAAPR